MRCVTKTGGSLPGIHEGSFTSRNEREVEREREEVEAEPSLEGVNNREREGEIVGG